MVPLRPGAPDETPTPAPGPPGGVGAGDPSASFGDEKTLELFSESHPPSAGAKEAGLTPGFGDEKTEEIDLFAREQVYPGSATRVARQIHDERTVEMAPATFRLPADPGEASRATTAHPPMPSARTGAARRLLFALLFTWASVATILAAWLWLHWPEEPSQLENLPDDGTLQGRVISPLERLSSREVARLGQTIRLGALEITPRVIENRPVRLMPSGVVTEPVLVLHLDVKNTSDESIYPSDPAFLYPVSGRKLAGLPMFDATGYSYTFLHPADDPSRLLLPFDLPHELGQTVAGQEFPRLGPGEEAELIVISGEDARRQLAPAMWWRVKVRKGRMPDRRTVAAVFAVAFKEDDVIDGGTEPLPAVAPLAPR